MAVRFRCTDPLGRQITLSDSVWFDHIVQGHPEFRHREALLRTTLTLPDTIQVDRRFPLRDVYYHSANLPSPFTGLLVRVVVHFYAAGEVVTAHFTREPHHQERRRWP